VFQVWLRRVRGLVHPISQASFEVGGRPAMNDPRSGRIVAGSPTAPSGSAQSPPPGALTLCAAGDVHGQIDRFYREVLAFEAHLGRPFDLVVQVGDLGVWPDPGRIDRATRKHDDIGDFPAWWKERRAVPRPTVFVKGNHEDFTWLDGRAGGEVLPGLTYLANGRVLDCQGLRIAGLGGCHSPADYVRPSAYLVDRQKRHYTQDEIERLQKKSFDILVTHDAPGDADLSGAGKHYKLPASGIAELAAARRPRLHLFGHHHVRYARVDGDRATHGLAIVGARGFLSAFAIPRDPASGPVYPLGDWPA
jgi:Icc-related predicted phosphoesterase